MAIERIRQASKELSLKLAGTIYQKGLINDLRLIGPRTSLIENAQEEIAVTEAYLDLLDKTTLKALKSAGVPVSVYNPSPKTRAMLVDHQHVAFLVPVSADGEITTVEQYIVRHYKKASSWFQRITGYPRKVFATYLPSSLQP